mmetsp:Transcript_17582/g.59758  ORF Transcript_17582/g.59758 Transcript_17582/m.59758 type:complete len:201 (-) Transcript_17582:843-1445(-)
MALPRVSMRASERKPMSARDGTWNMSLLRTPVSLYSLSSPFLCVSFSMMSPVYSVSTSTTTSSMGSSISPSSVSFMSTLGGETHSSKPSRRMASMRMPSCSSPRPWTSIDSPSPAGRMVTVTLFSVSFTSRLWICPAVSCVPPPLPERGPSLGPKDMEMTGGVSGGDASGEVTPRAQTVSETAAVSAVAPASASETMSPA